jgi:competence protein ComEC
VRDLLSWLAGAWATGIALTAFQPVPRALPLLLAAAALGASCASSRLRPGALVLAALAGGAVAYASHADVARPLPGPVEVTLEGRVVRTQRDGVLLEELLGLPGVALPGSVLLRDPQAEDGETSLVLAPEGERIRARARLRPSQRPRNPGDGPFLIAETSPGAVGRLVHPGLWVRRDVGVAWLAWVHHARNRIATRLAHRGQGGALLAALAVGRRDALDPALRDAIAQTGLGHLLAVSGLHLALVGGLGFSLARGGLGTSAWLAARVDTRRLALLIAWLAVSAYALLSGGAPSVQRAWVCLSLPIAALLLGRPGRLRASLAAALLLLLVQDPLALFSPGAQLSFVASAALSREVADDPGRGALVSLIRASATAMLATAPLVALHFTPVGPSALPLNWLAVPWTAFVLLPAALLGGAMALWEGGAGWLAVPVWCGEISLAAAARSAELFVAADRAPPSAFAVAGAAGLALAALRVPGTRVRLLACVAVTTLLACAPPDAVGPAPPRVVVFDVGQGDAILLEGREAAVLVDAGVALPDGPDRGRDVVLPALRALGVVRLDVVVVTHADLDHRGGVPAVLAGLPVDRLWVPPGAESDPRYAEVLEVARRRGVVVEARGAGTPAEAIGDLWLRPVWPPLWTIRGSSNDRSLVLQVEVGGRRVLLPGDLEGDGERALLSTTSDLGSDVLLLGHHGSRTSSSIAFLDAVSPRVALVSAPCLGRFLMPHPEVEARLRHRGVPVHWTGRDGALRVSLRGRLSVEGMGERRLHCRAAAWRDEEIRRMSQDVVLGHPASGRSAGSRVRSR